VERLCVSILAALLLALPARAQSAASARSDDFGALTRVPAACTGSDTRSNQSCVKEVGARVHKLSSGSSNLPLMQGLPILDQNASTTALCDVVKTWADQSLSDIQSVWRYLEKHEADWSPQMKTRIEAAGKQQIGPRLETLREKAGLGKPCGWVAWGSFKTFGSRVAANQQIAPDVVAEIAEALSKGLSKAPPDPEALEASKAFLRAIGNAVKAPAK
jgi:hypothetical protein